MMKRTGLLLLLACAAAAASLSLPAAAFDLQSSEASLSPDAIPFALYEQRRRANPLQHPAPEQRPDGLRADPLPSPAAVHVTFMHINDLYEIIPSGSLGGVARAGAVLKRLDALNPGRTRSVLAGDLFSPSALSTVPVNGVPFNGKQMVACMNAMGLDVATLGNHETDVKVDEFTARLSESEFPWVCANALNFDYPNLQKEGVLMHFNGSGAAAGKSASVGIWGVTYDSNNKAYQSYTNFSTTLSIAAEQVAAMQAAQADVVVALTHLPYWHDETLTQTVSGIDIVMGGHEHKRIQIVSPGLAPIYKADSNVQSAWVHDIFVDPSLPQTDPQRLVIQSVLVAIDSAITPDPDLAKVVDTWVSAAFAGFEEAGFHPAAPLATPSVDLVGNNEVIFAQATVLTNLFNLAMLEECAKYASASFVVPPIDATLFNAGAIRIDDTIPAGTVMTQYDAIRISPYLNAVAVVNVTGAILLRVLQASEARLNNSQHLHGYPNITISTVPAQDGAVEYNLNGAPLDPSPARWYTLGLLGFLLSGQAPYDFLLPEGNEQLRVLQFDQSGKSDVRGSIINQIATMFPSSPTPTPTPTPTPGGGGGDTRIGGMRVWLFGLLMGLVCVVLVAAVYLANRSCRNKNAARAERAHAAFLQHQYDDSAMYAHDV